MRTSDEVVQDLPWRWRVQGQIFVIGGLGFLFDAWDVTLNGFLIPLVGPHWGLTGAHAAWLGTANLAGMAVGACTWGAVADLVGRRRAFGLTVLTFALFSAAGAVVPDFSLFCLFRALAGLGLGGCVPVVYALVGEFTPTRVRGRVLVALNVWWPIGATLCGLVATALAPDWRLMLLVMVGPALLVLWVRRAIPESPLYLARRGQHEQARAVVADLVRRTGAAGPPPGPGPAAPADRPGPRGPGAPLRQARALWRYDPRLTAALWASFLTVFLVYFGALTWMPSILRAQGYGTYAAFLVTTLMNAVGIAGVVVSALLADLTGRRWLVVVSAPVAALALVLFAGSLGVPSAARVWIAVYGFVIELAIPALYSYAAEVYPTRLRASGFGWASMVSRIGAGAVPVLLGSLLWPALGLGGTFLVLAVATAVATGLLAVGAPETRGRALDQAPTRPPPAPERFGAPAATGGGEERPGAGAG